MHFLTRVAALATLLMFSLGFSASAQDVRLQSLDGSIELSGTLIGFDGEFYRVDTVFGPLTVDAQGVSCRGPGCPDLDHFVAELRFQGAPVIADQILPTLIERFAADRGMIVQRQILAENRSLFALVREEDDILAARFWVSATTTKGAFATTQALRLGAFDVLVGINLLREGLDMPEVSLVAILDADKEGFLRSDRSLIQTIGRAARNINGD